MSKRDETQGRCLGEEIARRGDPDILKSLKEGRNCEDDVMVLHRQERVSSIF
jgi:hypothetical protein